MTLASRFISLPVLFFTATLGVYLYSAGLYPTGVADSDELISAGHSLSIAHPPGYGLQVVLIHLAQNLMIFTNPAHASHILAALLHLTTLIFIYKTVHLIRVHEWPQLKSSAALIGIASLAFSSVYWRYASTIEVMSLGSLFMSLILFSATSWYYSKNSFSLGWFMLTSILFGMGVGHLQTIITLAPALLYLCILKHVRQHQSVVSIATAAAGGIGLMLVGFAVTALILLPLNARQTPVSWYFDQSLAGLWHLVSRSDYKGHFIEKNLSVDNAYLGSQFSLSFLLQLPTYMKYIWNQFVGLPLFLLVGVYLSLKESRKGIVIFLCLAFVLTGICMGTYVTIPIPKEFDFSYHMMQGISERQYVFGLVPLGMLLSLGALILISKLELFLPKHRFSTLIIPTFILLISSSLTLANARFGVMRHYQSSYHTLKSSLNTVESESVIICGSDISCYGLYYLSEVERVRPDVTILSNIPQMRKTFLNNHPNYVGHNYASNPLFYAQLVSWNVKHRPTYLTDFDYFYADYIGFEGNPFYLIPHGLLYKVETKKTPVPSIPTPSSIADLISFQEDSRDFYTKGVKAYFASRLALAAQFSAKLGDSQKTIQALDASLSLQPNQPMLFLIREQFDAYAAEFGYPQAEASSSARLMALAEANLLQSNYETSYKLAKQAHYFDPTDPNPVKMLLTIYQKINRPDYAKDTEAYYQQLTKTNSLR